MTNNVQIADVFSSASYSFNPFAVPNAVAAVLVLCVCVAAMSQTRGNRVGQLFVILGMSGFIWLSSRAFVYSANRADVAEWWVVWYLGSMAATPAVLYHLGCEILQNTRQRLRTVWLSWLFACAAIALQLRFGVLQSGVMKLSVGYVAQSSVFGKIVIGGLYLVCLAGLRDTIVALRAAPENSLLRKRIKLMLTVILLVTATSFDGFASSGFDAYQPGWLSVSCATLVLLIMIRQSRIVDITPEFATGLVIDRLQNATLVIEREGQIRMANPAAAELTTVSCKALAGMNISEALPNLISARLMQKLGETGHSLNDEVVRQSPSSGKEQTLQLSIAPLKNDTRTNPGFIVSLNDISQLKEAQRSLQHLSLHDSLTGLANRRLFMTELERSFARYVRNNEACFTLVFIDLDKFKPVNDEHGHQVGDALLRAIAARIQSETRDSDYCARLGGDEFAILASDAKTKTDAEAVIRRLQKRFAEPISLNGLTIVISASIGYAQPDIYQHRSHDQLLHTADKAMYAMKGSTQTQPAAG